jgi:hypothetical protein
MPGTAADTVIRIGLKALGLDAVGTCRSALSATRRCVCRRCQRASLSLWSLRIWSFSKPSASVTRFSWIPWPTKPPFPMGGAVTTQPYVKEKRDTVLRYVKAMAQALHYLKTNREGSMAIIPRYARFQRCIFRLDVGFLSASIVPFALP